MASAGQLMLQLPNRPAIEDAVGEADQLLLRGARGAVALARTARPFRTDEQTLLAGLLGRADTAVREILGHETLREQAGTDPLTGLGNRRKLSADLTAS